MAVIVGCWVMAMSSSVIPVEFIVSMSKVSYPFWIGFSLTAVGVYQLTALITKRIRWRQVGATLSAAAWLVLFYITVRQDYASIVTPCSLAFTAASVWAQFRLYVMVTSESGPKTH